MTEVTIRRRLRPLRLAFLVEPTNRLMLMRVIEANTCVWGGRYNCIIPYCRAALRQGRKSWSRDAAVRGYIARFEPDFLVDLVGEGKRFFDGERVIAENEVFDGSKGHITYGLNVNAILLHAYQHEYRFVRRHPVRSAMPAAAEPEVDLVIAAAFGRYPSAAPMLTKNFRDVFEPNEDAVTADNLYATMRATTPLKTTAFGLDPRGGGRGGTVAVILDGGRPQDVIDFWNLRALGWQVIPFPLRWEAALQARAREVLHAELKWYGTIPYMLPPEMAVPTRLVSRAVFDRVVRDLGQGAPSPLSSRSAYPALWSVVREPDELSRCTLDAGTDEHQRRPQGPRRYRSVSLPPLVPKFAEEWVTGPQPKWAIVYSMTSDSPIPTVASIVPTGLENVAALLRVHERHVAVHSEGLTFFPADGRDQFFWLPEADEIADAWFRKRGHTITTSSAGLLTTAIVRAFRGFHRIGSLAHERLLKKLDEMSHGQVRWSAPDANEEPARKPLAFARFESRPRIFGLLRELHTNRDDVAERHLQNLLDARVLRVGLQLRCPECARTTWFPVEDVKEHLRCERCLHEFPFPAARPPSEKAWAYRTQGPFSVENYADGSYTVVLVLRMLTSMLFGTDYTWLPSTIMKHKDGHELEADFVMWRRDRSDAGLVLVLGECKSYGSLGSKDFARARALAEAFPGAFHVFATLKADFTPSERKSLASFAKAGRKPLPDGRWRAPIVVVTGRELFGDIAPPHCWKNLGEAFERAAKFTKPAIDFLSFAQGSQLAYLGIEPDTARLW